MRTLAATFILAGACMAVPLLTPSVNKGQKAELADFKLMDHQGVEHSLYGNSEAKAIVIIGHGNSCPILQKSSQKINALVAQYGSRGVRVWMINPNSEDTPQTIVQETKEFDLKVPVLIDSSQAITRSLGLTRTSEAVIVSPENWKIVYRGAIDDELDYGVNKQRVNHHFLGDALEDLLARRPIAHPAEPAKGCLFSFFAQDKK